VGPYFDGGYCRHANLPPIPPEPLSKCVVIEISPKKLLFVGLVGCCCQIECVAMMINIEFSLTNTVFY